MKKLSPLYIFIFGSVLLIVSTVLYYLLIPKFEYFGTGTSIYKPGSALPDKLSGEYSVSNVYLIFKFGEYLFGYLGSFILVYFICSKVERIKITSKYVWAHLILITLAFILLIYLNPYIVSRQSTGGYLSDVYISGHIDSDVILQWNKLSLWYSSLQTPTSIAGVGLCVAGVVVFVVGTFGRMEYRR